jgi:hypothetical protein
VSTDVVAMTRGSGCAFAAAGGTSIDLGAGGATATAGAGAAGVATLGDVGVIEESGAAVGDGGGVCAQPAISAVAHTVSQNDPRNIEKFENSLVDIKRP